MKPAALTTPAEACSEHELITRIVRSGQVRAFEVLMRRHNRLLYRTARGILGDDREAEDCLQEAYLQRVSLDATVFAAKRGCPPGSCAS